MQTALGRFQPISAAATYCSGIPCGPVIVDVQRLKVGKTVGQASAVVRGKGASEPGLMVMATFADIAEPARQSYAFPAWVPPPEQCAPVDPAIWESMPIFNHTEWLQAPVPKAHEPRHSPAIARAVEWERMLVAPILPDGRLDTIATTAFFADSLASAAIHDPALRSGGAYAVALDLSVQFFAQPVTPWILKDARIQHESQGFVYGSVELWSQERALLGIAHQRALCRALKR
jgi:acyl-CoA thioesterase